MGSRVISQGPKSPFWDETVILLIETAGCMTPPREEKKRKEEERRGKKRKEEKRRLSGWLGGAVGPTRKIGAFYLDAFWRRQICYAI